MGCIFSKGELHDVHPKIFQVINVDDQGNCVKAGQIEVTNADLVLHQKNRASIWWPLRSLRRYGWDAELFSFESGRRAPSGPGIYAFKCHRAQELFNLLQTQFAAEESLSNGMRDSTSIQSIPTPRRPTSNVDGYLEPVAPRVVPRIRTTSTSPNGGARVRLDSVDSCSETQSPSPSTSTPPTVMEANVSRSESAVSGFKTCEVTEQRADVEKNNNGHEYSNGVVTSAGLQFLDALPVQLSVNTFEETDNSHVYMNVSPGTEPKFSVLNPAVTVPCVLPTLSNLIIPEETNVSDTQHCYANLELPDIDIAEPEPEPEPVVVNYAVLDLDQTGNVVSSSASVSSLAPTGGVIAVPPDSPPGQGPSTPTGYVTIDFEKTKALQTTARSHSDREETRKIRQNSTLNHFSPD